jgi:hypothetical protein
MFARVARYRIPEENLDQAVDAFSDAARQLQEIEGSAGGYLLIDRENCTALTVVFWQDRRSLEASEVRASRLRSQAIAPLEGEIQAIDRCDVALDFSQLTRV